MGEINSEIFYLYSSQHVFTSISSPTSVTFYDRWEGGTPDLSISGTLALVLLSILHRIDFSVILPYQSWKLGLSTWAILYFINHWLEGAKKCCSDGSDLSLWDRAVKVIAVQTLNCGNIYTVTRKGGTREKTSGESTHFVIWKTDIIGYLWWNLLVKFTFFLWHVPCIRIMETTQQRALMWHNYSALSNNT